MPDFTDSRFIGSEHTSSPAGGNVDQSSLRQLAEMAASLPVRDALALLWCAAMLAEMRQ